MPKVALHPRVQRLQFHRSTMSILRREDLGTSDEGVADSLLPGAPDIEESGSHPKATSIPCAGTNNVDFPQRSFPNSPPEDPSGGGAAVRRRLSDAEQGSGWRLLSRWRQMPWRSPRAVRWSCIPARRPECGCRWGDVRRS
eukprot:16287719-Heterocapsa_arctica.AAC.1